MIYSIDPGINSTGIAKWDETRKAQDPAALQWYGVVKTKKTADLGSKVMQLHDKLEVLIIKIHDRPSRIIIERPDTFTYKKRVSRSGKAINYEAINRNNIAVGVIAGTLRPFTEEILFYTAPEWKGKQNKQLTLAIVNEAYGIKLTPAQHDIADAIGLGKWWLWQAAMEANIKKWK